MNKYKCNSFILLIITVFLIGSNLRVQATTSNSNIFELVNKDKSLSPYTGMSRQHWKDAAKYLLEGAFSYVHSIDDPLDFPKQPGKSYPKDAPMVPVAKLEALCRTMFLAGPLLKEEPNLVINNINVGDYYRRQITLLLKEGTPIYIAMNPPKHNGGQVLVEMGGLAVSLMLAPEVFWDPLPQSTKDALAKRMLSYGEGETIEMNWRFFNINIMSFFKSRGYKTNDQYLEYLIKRCLDDYRGNGWYCDSPYYDYYSMWAFQMYGPLWAKYFGKKYYPQFAKQFLDNLKDIPDNYPHMFGRNGKLMMWGRSITYRMGAAVPLALTGLLNSSDINYGWMRYIASSSILQFLQHPDFLKDRVPTLGFYGAFEPAVQLYSCRGSAFWMGKLFLALYMPKDNPFWLAKENLGDWKKYKKDEVYNKYTEKANILITNHANLGVSEIRSTASSENIGIYHGTENYNRLSYNSEFPWQADGKNGEVAMNYVFKNKENEWEATRIYEFKKYENGFYCRNACLASDRNVKMVLTELPINNGILRIDKITTPNPISVRFGHYALPYKGKSFKKDQTKLGKHDTYIVDNGEFRLGMTNLKGWDKMEFVSCEGLHPESKKSIVIDSESMISGEKVFITVLLFDKTNCNLNSPIKEVSYTAENKTAVVTFKDNSQKKIVLW